MVVISAVIAVDLAETKVVNFGGIIL